MNTQQARGLLNRLEGAYRQKLEESGKKEYLRIFAPLDYNLANKALDELIDGSVYMPTVAEFLRTYKEFESENKTVNDYHSNKKPGEIRCWVCMDHGYIFYHEKQKDQHGEENLYLFIAYCSECPEGVNYKYDGRPKSPYYTPSISEVMDVSELARLNRLQYETKKAPRTPLVDTVRSVAERMGA